VNAYTDEVSSTYRNHKQEIMKTLELTNEQIVSLINSKYPKLKVDIDDNDTVRVLPDEDTAKNGLPLFDYWAIDNSEKNYTMHVHNEFRKFLNDNGLWSECQNPECWNIYNI
jgi:hypothetical protein